jgi:hypothetical protein
MSTHGNDHQTFASMLPAPLPEALHLQQAPNLFGPTMNTPPGIPSGQVVSAMPMYDGNMQGGYDGYPFLNQYHYPIGTSTRPTWC